MSLREYRQAEGMTLRTLGRRLGVHLTTVGKWETGVKLPSAAHLARIDEMTAGRVRAASFVAASKARAAADTRTAPPPVECAAAA